MSPDGRDRAEADGLAFFGAITASVTHELNNVLSILDQSGGLLGDLAAGAAHGRPVDPARLDTVHERIDRQVRKGVEIVRRLNRFAHAIDEGAESFEVSEQVETLVSLARRFAELKKVRLEYEAHDEDLPVRGNAFALQHGLFVCLKAALDASREGDRIDVELRRVETWARLTVTAAAREREPGATFPAAVLTRLLEPSGGRHDERSADGGRAVVEIRLPLARSG
jgi:C4-dicarboxylate-specific signal transduction histidine kinase